MKQIVEFLSEGDESILVEVETPGEEEGEEEVAREGALVKATKSFKKALEAVKPISEVLIDKFMSLRNRPQELEVEFGIKMNAEAGLVIATSSIEANFKVKLKWKEE